METFKVIVTKQMERALMRKSLFFVAFSVFLLSSCENDVGKNNNNSKISGNPSAEVGIVFPTPSETVDLSTQIKLDLINNTGKNLEYLWWVRKPGNDWVALDAWSDKTSLSVQVEDLGVYDFQVDYRTKGAPDMVSKKWLGQTKAVKK
jgi:hypothetical protein